MAIDRKWSVLVAVGVGTFMTALDSSVANTILPVIRRSFHSDVDTVEWVVTVYILGISGLLLSFGRLGDLRGHRGIYLWGFGVFVASSALCGLAPSLRTLVGFRAIQAIGGAMLMANSPAILIRSFPAAERGKALGIQATMTYLGLVAGPSLGGWLAGQVGWRSVFYINIPIGIVALLLSVRFIPDDRPQAGQPRERFDLAGAGVFMSGLVALLLALNQGHAWGWTSPAIAGLAAIAIILVIAFLMIEYRAASPMLDLGMFRSRPFSAAAVSAVVNYVCVYSVVFLLPFYLIQARGLSPSLAGTILAVQPLIMAMAAPLSGTLSDRFNTRLLSTPGMAILGAGLLVLSGLGPDSPLSRVTTGLAIVGLGTGIFISPNNSALMGACPIHRRGIASGILATARNVGMALGVGLAGAILTTAQAHAADKTAGMFEGIRAGFLVAAGIAVLGVATSAVRGEDKA